MRGENGSESRSNSDLASLSRSSSFSFSPADACPSPTQRVFPSQIHLVFGEGKAR
ncbi:predicted protein [Plenodomus lingam JN3]|uniref:Predicted protein n=1 Tax=Leptosphaeria maculans (strain JN3 / isolate v23.1.3 / race Av1-4-5-6-7-8) TaxID=985895 RepID=E5A4Z0_LEPMJ|nr:predicted protein [Plenodomus lingam JN3]CBX98688.1 predicted protein [Plenodomus lingam JN3]